MKWFDELFSVDEEEFHEICKRIILTIFELMEEAITSDNGEELKELIEMEILDKLRNNKTYNLPCRSVEENL